MHSRRLTWFDLGWNAIVLTLLALLSTEVILYSRNTLSNHPQWATGKALMANEVMGAAWSRRTRNLLRRNRLNLHAWHGFNEILLTDVFEPGSMQFDFFLEENSYLSVVFNKNEDSFSGIRLSANSRFPSAFFRADATGEFREKQSLADLTLEPAWHSAKLVFNSPFLELSIDDLPTRRIWEAPLDRQVVGFRSGHREVIVDDVEIKSAGGNLIVAEDFRNDRYFWSLYFLVAACLGGVIGLVLLGGKIIGKGSRRAALWTFMLQFCLITVLVIYLFFDYFYWSSQYPYAGITPWGRQARLQLLEKIRLSCFDWFSYFDAANLKEETYPAMAEFLKVECAPNARHDLQVSRSTAPEKIDIVADDRAAIRRYVETQSSGASYKVLFLGTSQTWGSGAVMQADRIVPQTLGRLVEQSLAIESICLVNASVRGGSSAQLVERYVDRLGLIQPDLIVVNLSNNDPPNEFEDHLESLVRLSEDRDTDLLFVLEANSTEFSHKWLRTNHRTMRRVARRANASSLDLNGYLAQPDVYDSGILWWDMIHLTSYGQHLAAELIARDIVDNIKARTNRKLP